ncbi:Urokinase-Type Plasminogen Activator [Manis pentadactyla]|nr:Urokinase-Type Plasminogen Activator [Manis pentadactyla]
MRQTNPNRRLKRDPSVYGNFEIGTRERRGQKEGREFQLPTYTETTTRAILAADPSWRRTTFRKHPMTSFAGSKFKVKRSHRTQQQKLTQGSSEAGTCTSVAGGS